ncbi:MAG: hypothetical protein AVDCRST_MAG89-152, partial [uncultured Gemmatimonadetes bacterium]
VGRRLPPAERVGRGGDQRGHGGPHRVAGALPDRSLVRLPPRRLLQRHRYGGRLSHRRHLPRPPRAGVRQGREGQGEGVLRRRLDRQRVALGNGGGGRERRVAGRGRGPVVARREVGGRPVLVAARPKGQQQHQRFRGRPHGDLPGEV